MDGTERAETMIDDIKKVRQVLEEIKGLASIDSRELSLTVANEADNLMAALMKVYIKESEFMGDKLDLNAIQQKRNYGM